MLCKSQARELDECEARLKDARMGKYAAQRDYEKAAGKGRRAAAKFAEADTRMARIEYEFDEEEIGWVQSAFPFVLPLNSRPAGDSHIDKQQHTTLLPCAAKI